MPILFDQQTNFFCIVSHFTYPIDSISDDSMVRTQGIFELSFGVLLNHRGSSMNLEFQLIL